MKRLHFLWMALLAAVILAAAPAEAAWRKKQPSYRSPDRFAEIVIEAESGYVLSEKNADKRLYPASLTKMMTLYLAFDAMDKGLLGKNQQLPVSRHAARQKPSSLGLSAGETIRAEDAILAVTTKSANDCAVVLAEAVGGSEERFARQMTLKARQLGMNNTHFVNASGLFSAAQISSARDMAILARALIHDFPRHYHYFGADSFTWNGDTFFNHNKLMGVYPGMDGLKTGYVYASGYNLAASAVRDGTRLIGVVFGGRTPSSRNKAMAQMLDHGFANVGDIRVAALSGGKGRGPLPQRRPVLTAEAIEAAAEISPAGSDEAAAAQPRFDAMGLSVDQGDSDAGEDSGTRFVAEFQPRPLNTALRGGGWAIQVGAFSSHEAGVRALRAVKDSLRGAVAAGVENISPLMTSRGMVYRARLAGLGRADAAEACRILQSNCLILSVE